MVDHERVEVARIGQGPAHHLGIGHASRPIGEGDGAGGAQQADLGHLLPAQTLGERRHRMDVHDGGVAGATQHEVDDRRVVDDRRGFRLTHDRGHAAGGGGAARRSQRLAVLGPGLADEGAHVDETRRNDPAAAVDGLGSLRHPRGADAAPRVPDHAVGDQHVSRFVEIARRIDDARVGEQDRARIGEHSAHTFGRLRESASSTAIRTATPISTCSRIKDCAPSATLESISTPRFIGPGCMTSASGLA